MSRKNKSSINRSKITGRRFQTARRPSLHSYRLSDRDYTKISRTYLDYEPVNTQALVRARPRRVEQKRELPEKSKLGFTNRLHAPIMENMDLRRVYICAKRRVRKEVIHALGRSGSGGSRPRYTQDSRVKC
ncbi:hypothetical protein [Microviridae sp.]|nr:hypothetical protein [Microviridae sp.]